MSSALTAKSQDNCVYIADDIYSGSFGSLPTNVVQYGSALYFSATGNSNGNELWKFENGTSSLVMDINPGIGSSLPNNFLVAGSYLYFTANNGVNGKELWRFDGVSASMVADIFVGSSSSMPENLTMIGSTLYFTANNGINGIELWKFDGTTASLVADIFAGVAPSNPSEITEYGTNVFFTADNGVNGVELWSYDGSTVSLFDINVGSVGSMPGELIVFNGVLCFRANDGINGNELWYYDGSSTFLVDVNPTGNSNPYELTIFGSELVFRAFDFVSGTELWKFDGVAPTLVSNIYPGAVNSFPSNLTVMGSELYFAANNGTVGVELFRYDGSTVTLAADIYPGGSPSMPVNPVERFVVMDDRLYIVATNNFSGNEVFSFDGTNLILGKDIVSGPGTSSPTEMTPFGSVLYFMADNGVIGGELWAWNPNADLDTSVAVVSCGNYISPAGDLYNSTGNYTFVDTIPSLLCPGCDSLIAVDLTITDQPSSSQTIITCDDYLSPAGNLYTIEGHYNFVDVIPSISCIGLDSIITIDLTIVDQINSGVVVFSGVLVSLQSGAVYQWLDCDNGYTPVPGATDQDFIPTVAGNYACSISLGTCSDTTVCNYVVPNSGVGLHENDSVLISVFPNPFSGDLTIKTGSWNATNILIYDGHGNIVWQSESNSEIEEIDMRYLAKGVYFVHITNEYGSFNMKIVKE
ncbi:MAG: T9SS type A sorting domain-containing protein [Crocinitomicaceae bacterium]|nr:T9SS type A sorting domain-containing protein [Crocinitomicaceae bacterium]